MRDREGSGIDRGIGLGMSVLGTWRKRYMPYFIVSHKEPLFQRAYDMYHQQWNHDTYCYQIGFVPVASKEGVKVIKLLLG